MAVADFNGDGKPDLAVLTSTDVRILLGNGDGTFQASTQVYTATFAYSITVGDFNGDGKPDLAVPRYTFNSVEISLGNGDGTFQTPAYVYTGAAGPQHLVAEDFNGDGNTDLAVSNTQTKMLVLLLATGHGDFFTPVNYDLARTGGSGGLAVTDVNGDGKLDILVSPTAGGVVLYGDGQGAFGLPRATSLGTKAVVGDFNGDGVADVAYLNSSGVWYYLGNPSVSCDLGGDGNTNVHDVQTIINEAMHVTMAIHDLNGDGVVDADDVLKLIDAALGRGCAQ